MAYSLALTEYGKAAIANAITGAGAAVAFHSIVLSPGNVAGFEPDIPDPVAPGGVTLPVASVSQDTPGNIVIRALVPPDNGGYYVSSIYVLDAGETVLAYAGFPTIYKPAAAPDNASAQWDLSFALQIGADAAPAIVTPTFADWLAELLASAGSSGGQDTRAGSVAVPIDAFAVTVSFPTPYPAGIIPIVNATMRIPDDDSDYITAVVASVSNTGFSVRLSASPDVAGYRLDYIALKLPSP
jgi:hypothetical protein